MARWTLRIRAFASSRGRTHEEHTATLDCLCIGMYKYSFAPEMTMAHTASLVDSAAAGPSRVARVAIVGATGFAGQELVRILARHPAVTLTAAMSSAATSAPRPLPALARIWEGA